MPLCLSWLRRQTRKYIQYLPLILGGDNCTRFRPFHIPLALVSRKDNPLPAPVDQIGRCGEKELGIFGRRTALYNLAHAAGRSESSAKSVSKKVAESKKSICPNPCT